MDKNQNSSDFAEKLNRRRLYSHAKPEDGGVPLADYLALHFHRLDRAGWQRRIAEGSVLVNGISAAAETLLRDHDCISWFPGDLPEPEADLRFRTVYEDSDLLVVDKPGNLCVHPTGPFFRHTLWHLLGSRYGEIRFVNRLDRETSGLVAAARNARTAAAMDNRNCPMHKEYLALVFGRFRGTVRAKGFLEHDPASAVFKKKRFVTEPSSPDSQTADTELREESAVGTDFTLVRAIPHIGRQHQIRATLFSLGFPLVGDKLYGPDETVFLRIRTKSVSPEDLNLLRMSRQALHSAGLSFRHPLTGKMIECESPLPEDFLKFMETVRSGRLQ